LCRFHSDSCRAGRAIHGQSSISGSIAAAWRLAIFEKDWLVHSRNRGLSATVLTCVVEYFALLSQITTILADRTEEDRWRVTDLPF
jgi:hypothetical protein